MNKVGMKKNIIAVLTIVIAVSALAGCGKRGDLVPPAGSTYPQQYPKQ